MRRLVWDPPPDGSGRDRTVSPHRIAPQKELSVRGQTLVIDEDLRALGSDRPAAGPIPAEVGSESVERSERVGCVAA